jgi:hypothetical protein
MRYLGSGIACERVPVARRCCGRSTWSTMLPPRPRVLYRNPTRNPVLRPVANTVGRNGVSPLALGTRTWGYAVVLNTYPCCATCLHVRKAFRSLRILASVRLNPGILKISLIISRGRACAYVCR